jgi:glycosyltransferase involved in cell wall biosynthesis
VEVVASAIKGESIPRAARILLVAAPALGGIRYHVVSLMECLQREGYQVGVACEASGPVAEAARELSLPFYEVTASHVNRTSGAAPGALRVVGAARDLQAHIIHTHSFRAGLIGALAAPLARPARLVATVHNYPPGAQTMQTRRARDRWAIRLLVRNADRVITVSEELRRELLLVGPGAAEKSATIPNGIDMRAEPEVEPATARAEFGLPAERPLVGMVARLAPAKGVEEFIRAARLVATRHPEATFVLAGDGPLREEAELLSDALGLSEALHMLGEVSSPRKLIRALDVLVVASTSEGSSIAAMEAMAGGRPVVATAVGGVPEVVADGETGILVRPGDARLLAESIDSLLGDPEAARQMGERGRRRAVEEFDVERMVERIRAVYSDVLREQVDAGGVGP